MQARAKCEKGKVLWYPVTTIYRDKMESKTSDGW